MNWRAKLPKERTLRARLKEIEALNIVDPVNIPNRRAEWMELNKMIDQLRDGTLEAQLYREWQEQVVNEVLTATLTPIEQPAVPKLDDGLTPNAPLASDAPPTGEP